jgi:hypothetical protein
VTPVLWPVMGVTVAVGLGLTALGFGREILLGLAAPVLTTAASWAMMTRVWAAEPVALTQVMIRAFALKAAFFMTWVVIMLKGLEVRPEPFVASLTGAFLVLHFTEAWDLKRLMDSKDRAQ